MSFRITELWAWTAIDPDNDEEGAVGFRTREGWMPLVMADKARMASMRHVAVEIARASGKTLRLIRFSVREDIETLDFIPPGVHVAKDGGS